MIQLKSIFSDIPKQIRFFLGKALLFFIIWKVIYGLFLYDSKVLDFPLTEHVANSSVMVLNEFTTMSGFTAEREVGSLIYDADLIPYGYSHIYHNQKLVLNVADACNGLEFLVLYLGFIVCMPSNFWRKVKYISIGILVLDGINILRASGLIYLREYFHAYFDFAHHYLFKVTVYSAAFIMWMVFTRNIQLKE
jgi:exosortase/archaeosortase family protein